MKEFNLIKDNLNDCKKYNHFYIIGFEGNLQEMRDKKRNWDAGDNTKGMLLIYNSHNDTIAWKMVKVSKKGHFVNLSGRVYLDDFS